MWAFGKLQYKSVKLLPCDVHFVMAPFKCQYSPSRGTGVVIKLFSYRFCQMTWWSGDTDLMVSVAGKQVAFMSQIQVSISYLFSCLTATTHCRWWWRVVGTLAVISSSAVGWLKRKTEKRLYGFPVVLAFQCGRRSLGKQPKKWPSFFKSVFRCSWLIVNTDCLQF